MACACGAGMPGQGVDPGICVDSACPFTTGGHCRCVHLPNCPECNRSGWHTAYCSQPDGEVRQHRMDADCWCQPVAADNGAWDHR